MNTFVEIAATMTDACFMAWFVPKFCGLSVKKKRWTLIFPLTYLIIQLIFDNWLTGFVLLPMVVIFMFTGSFSIALRPRHYIWALFCSSCFSILLMLTNSFVYTVFFAYLDDINLIYPGVNLGMRVLYLMIAKIVLLSLYQLVVKLFGKDRNLAFSNGVASIVLMVISAIGLSALMKIASETRHLNVNIEVFVMAFILIGINIVFYFLLWQNQKLQKNKYELQLMKDRISFEERRSEEATIIWDNIKKVRHDLKNHFCYLRAQLESSNYEECKKYLLEIQSSVDSMGNLIKSGNSVIDYLINTKLSTLNDTRVFIAGDVSNFSDIADIDMVCILGNILDNAVEALEKVDENKRIELYFSKVNSNRIIACKNTIASSVLDADNHLILTKRDVDFHGLGHKIIESTAEKYGGYVDYFEEDDVFGVQVSIPELFNENGVK